MKNLHGRFYRLWPLLVFISIPVVSYITTRVISGEVVSAIASPLRTSDWYQFFLLAGLNADRFVFTMMASIIASPLVFVHLQRNEGKSKSTGRAPSVLLAICVAVLLGGALLAAIIPPEVSRLGGGDRGGAFARIFMLNQVLFGIYYSAVVACAVFFARILVILINLGRE